RAARLAVVLRAALAVGAAVVAVLAFALLLGGAAVLRALGAAGLGLGASAEGLALRTLGGAAVAGALAAATALLRLAAGAGQVLGRRLAAGDGDLDAHQPFDVAQQMRFVRRAEGDGDAVAAVAGGAADAVDIGVR